MPQHSSQRTQDRRNRPLRDLRVSVTDRCNLRCEYCMPKEIFGQDFVFMAREKLLNFDEIERVVRAATELGVRKVRLTGGEPLLRRDIERLIAQLAQNAKIEDLCMTTNGLALTQARASQLFDAGLKRISISLDALDDACFACISNTSIKVSRVLDAIEIAQKTGFDPVKVNCVVQKERNTDQIVPLVRYFRHTRVIVRFIEFMDVGNHNAWHPKRVFSAAEIRQLIERDYPLEPLPALFEGEVSSRWRHRDGAGEIGIIASITQPFCAACNRGRLAADGQFYTCLFAQKGYDLKTSLRQGMTDAQLKSMLSAIWSQRNDQYSVERWTNRDQSNTSSHKVEMYYVGG